MSIKVAVNVPYSGQTIDLAGATFIYVQINVNTAAFLPETPGIKSVYAGTFTASPPDFADEASLDDAVGDQPGDLVQEGNMPDSNNNWNFDNDYQVPVASPAPDDVESRNVR